MRTAADPVMGNWERTLVASRFPTELCAEQSGGFRAVGVDSWLVVAGGLEISVRVFMFK